MNKHLNIAAAEALGLEEINVREDTGEVLAIVPKDGYRVFDLSDSNCRDLVIEHFKITVQCRSGLPEMYQWGAHTPDGTIFADASRDKAIDKCIAKCLNVEYEDE